MHGDINRDWKIVDWHAVSSDFDDRLTVSATVNGFQVRAYDLDKSDMTMEMARLFDDMLAALKQHRGQP